MFGVSKAEDENNVYSIEVKHNDDGYDDEPTIKIVQQDDSEIAAIGITTSTDNEDDEFIIVVDDDDVAVTIRMAKKTASTLKTVKYIKITRTHKIVAKQRKHNIIID